MAFEGTFHWTAAQLSGPGLYLSDLHAGRDAEADQDLRGLLHWLTADDRGYRWLCWGGDIFDFLAAGNRVSLGRTLWVLDAMRALAARGVQQYLIEGNHDFHLEFLAREVPGLVVVPDGLRDVSAGVALVHGDWHTAGGLYGPMRRVFRSRWLAGALARGPHGLIDAVAQTWSRTSHEVRGGPPEPEYLAFVAQRFHRILAQDPQCQLWLSGHVHWPARIQQGGATCYINGEWAVHRTVMEVPGDGTVRYCLWQAAGLQPYAHALAEL